MSTIDEPLGGIPAPAGQPPAAGDARLARGALSLFDTGLEFV